MNLLFYSPKFYPSPGGTEKVISAWASVLKTKGVNVAVATHTKTNKGDEFCFDVYRRPSLAELRKLVLEAEAVLLFDISLKLICAWIFTGKPLIVAHTHAMTMRSKPGFKNLFKYWISNRLAASNFCCSEFMSSQFNRSQVVYMPYEAGIFYNQRRKRKPGTLLFAGKLVKNKGVDVLLDALAILDPALEFRLEIVGEGPEKNRLIEAAVHLGISDKVNFRGKLTATELVSTLNQTEIVVIPSTVEAFGIIALEALACGCKLVVSNAGGLPEATGRFATFFESGNPAALADAISATLSTPVNRDSKLLKNHLERLSVENTSRQLIDALRVTIYDSKRLA